MLLQGMELPKLRGKRRGRRGRSPSPCWKEERRRFPGPSGGWPSGGMKGWTLERLSPMCPRGGEVPGGRGRDREAEVRGAEGL